MKVCKNCHQNKPLAAFSAHPTCRLGRRPKCKACLSLERGGWQRRVPSKVDPETGVRLSHGMSRSKVYGTWIGMKSRCLNPSQPNYSNYGGRGITVCDRWKDSFSAFLEDMGMPVPGVDSIDRVDSNKGYFKENCRWVERSRNGSENTRSLKPVTVSGRDFVSMASACRFYGITRATLHARLKSGWDMEEAFLLPVQSDKKRAPPPLIHEASQPER